MLHDLYMLSCYFDPAQAALCEDDLKKRYGETAVRDATRRGFLEFRCLPCAKGDRRLLCRLSALGVGYVESHAAA